MNEQGEEMSYEEAVARGLVVFTKAEAAHFATLRGAKREAFLEAKRRQFRAQQKARFKRDRDELSGTHPLERFAAKLESEAIGDARSLARNRLKRLRRKRLGG